MFLLQDFFNVLHLDFILFLNITSSDKIQNVIYVTFKLKPQYVPTTRLMYPLGVINTILSPDLKRCDFEQYSVHQVTPSKEVHVLHDTLQKL